MVGKPCEAVWARSTAPQSRVETSACLMERPPAAAVYSPRAEDIVGIKSLGILSEQLRVYDSMQDETGGASGQRSFDEVVLPHLDAAYNLARWLVRNPHDAEDVVQEACLRAVRFFEGYHGGDARSWLLRIVRNTSYSFLEKRRPADLAQEFDESIRVPSAEKPDAEALLLRSAEAQALQVALQELPIAFREALILRELEGLSYKEIAEVMEIPIGTVMSSLARARAQLRKILSHTREREVQRDVRR